MFSETYFLDEMLCVQQSLLIQAPCCMNVLQNTLILCNWNFIPIEQ